MKTYKEFINELSVGDWIIDTAVRVVGGAIIAGTAYLAYKTWSKIKRKKFDKKAAPVIKKADRDIKRAGDNEKKVKKISTKRDESLDDIANEINENI